MIDLKTQNFRDNSMTIYRNYQDLILPANVIKTKHQAFIPALLQYNGFAVNTHLQIINGIKEAAQDL